MPQQSTSRAVAKLLQRQSQQPWQTVAENQRLLIVNPDGDHLCFLSADAWCFHAGHAAVWPKAYCQALPPALDDYEGVLVIVAKEQALNQYILRCLSALPVGTPIWLTGEKRGGVNTAVKRLPHAFGQVQKLASGNHCQLYQCRVTKAEKPTTQLDDFTDNIPIKLSDDSFDVVSLPGVFSKNRVDDGTRLLLEALPPNLPEPILDFACGNGIIAKALHRRQQPQLYASDVNPMAIAAATFNLQHANATVLLADGLPALRERVGTIVSNPPFHTGLRTDYNIATRFIAEAYQQLKPGGSLYLVANNFLPWPDVIERAFGHCNRTVTNAKFSVYHAQRT